MIKIKKGIALLITIGILTMISAVILTSFTLIENGFNSVSNIEKMTQTSVIIQDLSNSMKIIAKKVKDSDTLDMIMGAYPPLADELGRFSLQLELSPQFSKININSILVQNKNGYEQQKLKDKFEIFFENLLNKYQIVDSYLLLNLLMDTIDSDEVERDVGTEIVRNKISFLNGRIANLEHFKTILQKYEQISRDKNIWNIPWSELFYFGKDNKETPIDCNYMSKELAILLEFQFNEYFDEDNQNNSFLSFNCNLITGDNTTEENERIIKLFNIKKYKKGDSFNILGQAYYQTNSVVDSFSFIYELKSERIIDIEFKKTDTTE